MEPPVLGTESLEYLEPSSLEILDAVISRYISGDLEQAGRQHGDGGLNHLDKISYCKESLSCIIHRVKYKA